METPQPTPIKRGRGRPLGARNKSALAREAAAAPPPAPALALDIPPSRARARPDRAPATAHLAVETWPVSRLVPYEFNPRKNDHAVDRMVTQIREFGFLVPVLARSNGLIVDGHLRWKAAKKARLTEVPVIVADHLTDVQERAFRLAVNKAATWADFDFDLVTDDLLGLQAEGYALGKTGFSVDELSGLLDVDALDEEPTEPAPRPKQMKNVVCPKCGHAFSP